MSKKDLPIYPNSKILEVPMIISSVVEDLIYFEGPILSHVLVNSKNYFFLWVDSDKIVNRWLAFTVSEKNIKDFKQGEVSLKFLVSNRDSVLFFDLNNELVVERVIQTNICDVPTDLIPDEDSYLI